MGCFLGCFGLSKKRKRRKPAIRALIPDQRHAGCYKPLDSIYPDLAEENPIGELRVKPKERSSLKIRKKVTFNLNVEAFEPIQPDYHLLKSEEDNNEEEENQESSVEDAKGRLLATDSTASYCYPSNHRYQNCIYDEDEEIEEEESDLEEFDDDEGDIDDDNYDGGGSDQRSSQEEDLSGQSCTSSVDDDDDDGVNNHEMMPLCQVKSLGSSRNVRDRSKYVQPVLNPVQNLSQWKAIKSRTAAATAKPKHPRKENVGSNFLPNDQCNHPGMQELAVDASLSNWINTTTKSSCSEHVTNSGLHQVGLQHGQIQAVCNI